MDKEDPVHIQKENNKSAEEKRVLRQRVAKKFIDSEDEEEDEEVYVPQVKQAPTVKQAPLVKKTQEDNYYELQLIGV